MPNPVIFFLSLVIFILSACSTPSHNGKEVGDYKLQDGIALDKAASLLTSNFDSKNSYNGYKGWIYIASIDGKRLDTESVSGHGKTGEFFITPGPHRIVAGWRVVRRWHVEFNFNAVSGKKYVVRGEELGEAYNDRSVSIWIEEADTGRQVTEKVNNKGCISVIGACTFIY
jgi:hypothetical protein